MANGYRYFVNGVNGLFFLHLQSKKYILLCTYKLPITLLLQVSVLYIFLYTHTSYIWCVYRYRYIVCICVHTIIELEPCLRHAIRAVNNKIYKAWNRCAPLSPNLRTIFFVLTDFPSNFLRKLLIASIACEFD